MITLEEQLPYPELSRISANQPIAVVGGFYFEGHEKLARSLGLNIDWVATNNGSSGDDRVHSVAQRIRNGRVSALVILNELVSHAQSAILVEACKAAGIPFDIGKKGGKGIMLRVFSGLESRIASSV